MKSNVDLSLINFQVEAKNVAFDALFNLFPINFCWINTDGYIMGCNKHVLEAQEITSFNEIIGKHTTDVCSLEAWENTKIVIKSGKSQTFEEMHHKKDGGKIYFLSLKTPLRADDGTIVAIVNIAIDITDRKLMEIEINKSKEAERLANQSKTVFLSNMRHDLRTPLSGIISISEFLENTEIDSVKRNYLNDINQSAKSLLSHLNEILEYVKVDSGELPIIEKEFDIYQMINDVYNMMVTSANNKNIDFKIIIDEKMPRTLIGDISRTQRILMNLVSNAIKFTEKGYVKITIDWKQDSSAKGKLEFKIEDTGIGIPDDKKDIIFEPFNKLTSSYSGNYSGNGLGLNIVKQFLQDLGGKYYLTSHLKKGSSFVITIPYKIPLLKHIYENVLSYDITISQETKKILLVEDNDIVSRITKNILESIKELNCEVEVACTGKEAIALFNKHTYDLILLDIGLPDIDGYEVSGRIREKNSQVPIIALTAHSEDEALENSLKVGMNKVFTKPLTEKLAKSLEKFLS